MLKHILLTLSFLMVAFFSEARDTLRYSHTFRLPLKNSQGWYEKVVFSQHSTNVHSFIFYAPDSCEINIIVRSECDSLDMWIGDEQISKSTKRDGIFMYTGYKNTNKSGENLVTIRTPGYCGKLTFLAHGWLK